jgi:hypothetical protein
MNRRRPPGTRHAAVMNVDEGRGMRLEGEPRIIEGKDPS